MREKMFTIKPNKKKKIEMKIKQRHIKKENVVIRRRETKVKEEKYGNKLLKSNWLFSRKQLKSKVYGYGYGYGYG